MSPPISWSTSKEESVDGAGMTLPSTYFRSKKAFRNVWRQIRYLPLPIRRVCYGELAAGVCTSD